MFRNIERLGNMNGRNWLEVVVGHLRSRDLQASVTVGADDGADATVAIKAGGRRYTLQVEVKASAGPAVLRAIASRQPARSNVLVVTDHLTPAAIETCRDLGLGCADLDGNMYLRLGSTRIEVEGRARTRSKELVPKAHGGTTLMTRSAAQILFLLLAEPSSVALPTRDLAQASGAALGSVSTLLRELSTQGYLSTGSDGRRRLHRTMHLFDQWVEAYRIRLYARLDVGYYRTDLPSWWTDAEGVLSEASAQWGGETAAWYLNRHLRPAHGVIYAATTPTGLLRTFRMRKSNPEDANLILRHRFWNMPDWLETSTVPSPLIYADLAAGDDPRLAEAATQLRETDGLLRRLS